MRDQAERYDTALVEAVKVKVMGADGTSSMCHATWLAFPADIGTLV